MQYVHVFESEGSALLHIAHSTSLGMFLNSYFPFPLYWWKCRPRNARQAIEVGIDWFTFLYVVKM